MNDLANPPDAYRRHVPWTPPHAPQRQPQTLTHPARNTETHEPHQAAQNALSPEECT